MKSFLSHNFVQTDLDLVIEILSNAALTRDFRTFEIHLKPYFDNDLSLLTEIEQSYLSYFLGYYFVHFGKSKGLSNYQERGQDYLTRAMDQFRKFDLIDEAIEAEITLGWSYFNSNIENYEAFLLDALSRCIPFTEAYFSVSVSLLIVYYKQQKNKIDSALQIIEDCRQRILVCQNKRILCQFFNNAGLIFRVIKNYQQATKYYEKALIYSRELSNKQFEGQTLNCLAYCNLKADFLDDALENADSALEIFKQRNDKGFIASVLDTKALIQFAIGENEKALKTINDALKYFRAGESYEEWVEALWNKIEILESLRKQDLMIETFSELSAVTMLHLDLQQQEYYQRKFSKKIIVPFGKDIDEKMEHCERSIITPVLEAEREILKASEKLGFENYQTLSNRINNKYPDLKVYLKKDRKPRADKFEIRKISIKKKIISSYFYDVNSVSFYQVNQRIAKQYFQVNQEIFLMVSQRDRLENGDKVLMFHYFPIICSVFVNNSGFSFIDETGKTVSRYVEFVGKVIGFTPNGFSNKDRVEFRRI